MQADRRGHRPPVQKIIPLKFFHEVAERQRVHLEGGVRLLDGHDVVDQELERRIFATLQLSKVYFVEFFCRHATLNMYTRTTIPSFSFNAASWVK